MQTNKFKFAFMKSFAGLIILGTIFFFSACKKKQDSTGAPAPEPVVSSFTQKVVVEKYTGEWCGSCPSAGDFFDQMKTTYGSKFIGVGIHAGSSADRYKDNPADKAMYSFLTQELKGPTFSGTIGFPNVMFMRSSNPLNSQIINGYSSPTEWSKRVSDELAKKASCGLSLITKITGSTLSASVKFQISKALPAGAYAITAYVLENKLDGSLQVSGDPGYMHQHVLRELLTPKEGVIIDVAVLGKAIELKLTDVNIAAYNAGNLEVVAFIHKKGSSYSDRQIINGQIVKAGATQSFD